MKKQQKIQLHPHSFRFGFGICGKRMRIPSLRLRVLLSRYAPKSCPEMEEGFGCFYQIPHFLYSD